MKIHIHSKQGLYEVVTYGRNSIMLSTKHNRFQVPTNDFKSFAGGLWNHQVTKDEMDQFLAVVRPDEYKVQVATEDKILTLAARLDRIQAEVNALPIAEVLIGDNHIPLTEEESDEATYLEQMDNDYSNYLEEKAREEELRTPEKWNEMLAKQYDEVKQMKDKIKDIGSKVYSHKIDTSDIRISHNGIKFIIQHNYKNDTYRFCWDPFGFDANFHSSISEMHRENNWGTMNGGWIKIIGNNVILYAKSGDYGVYDDVIAIECAKDIFPTKQVHSFAGRQWDDELTRIFDELPF